MAGLLRETRLQIMLDDAELAAIDDWRFKQRMPSRAAAIRELLRLALKLAPGSSADPSRRSQDFGLLGDGNGGHSNSNGRPDLNGDRNGSINGAPRKARSTEE